MIITCNHCSMRLQVDDEKVPARAFTLRCPKCQNIVHAQPSIGTYEESALAVGHSPASDHPRTEMPAPAPPYTMETPAEKAAAREDAYSSSAEGKDLLRLLTKLLQRGAQSQDAAAPGSRFEWEARRVLVCVAEMYREQVARSLAAGEYQVYVAENKTQAIERMRDERMDILILGADFDPPEQGTAFINREISSLRLPERRRLFLVQLSETGRTLDAHAAFINNVSLIVNTADISKLPRSLERSLRDFNDLYRSFNTALGMSAI